MYHLVNAILRNFDDNKQALANHLGVDQKQVTRWAKSQGSPLEKFLNTIKKYSTEQKREWLQLIAKGGIYNRLSSTLDDLVFFSPQWLQAADRLTFVGDMWLERNYTLRTDIAMAMSKLLKEPGEKVRPRVIFFTHATSATDHLIEGLFAELKYVYGCTEELLGSNLAILGIPEKILTSPSIFVNIEEACLLEAKLLFSGTETKVIFLPGAMARNEFKHAYYKLAINGEIDVLFGEWDGSCGF